MQVIVVASSKGGAGKSTISTNLAAYFALQGKRTALIDADRQKSATHWCEKRAHLDSAVLPVAQLLLTLITGMPVRPTPYSAAWPAVLSPYT